MVSVTPTAKSSDVPLSVRVFAGDMLVVSESIRVKLSVRRQALVAAHDIDRGGAVDVTNTLVDERWMPFSNLEREVQALAAVPSEGAVAKLAIKASQVIGSRHVSLPLLVEKGDVVSVDCVRNGMVVRASLRAMTDGKLHEIIEFTPLARNRTAKDRRESREPVVIRGRVVGAGRAVMLLAGDPGAEPAKVPETTRIAAMEETR
jgi:flagella basal body P-ring formation protein FlgA